MKKRIKIIVPLAVLSVGCMTLAACGGIDFTYPDYSYQNPDFSGKPLEKDEGIVLDGKADEAFWKSEDRNWLMLNKATDEEVSLCATSYIGEKGLYMLFDVNDPSVYVNPDRDAFNNSGIELYLCTETTAANHAYEIDLNPDGRTRISLCNAVGTMSSWSEQFEFGVTAKGGEINTSECTGYVIEAFFPNRMFGDEVHELFYSDIAVISTVNETSTDREWYPFAQKEYGGTWMNPVSWFTFDANGYVGGKSVGLSQSSEHVSLTSHPMAVARFGYSVRLEAEDGYAITGLSVNGEPVDPDDLTEQDGDIVYRLKSVREDIELSVTTEAITAGNKTLSGTIYLHENGEKTAAGDVQLSLKNESGADVPVTLNESAFSLNDLPQGIYTFTVLKDGYMPLTREIAVNRNREIKLTLEANSLFAENTNWDLMDENDGVVTLKYGDGVVLQTEEGQDNFVFGYTIKPSEEALAKNVDLRYGIRASFQTTEKPLTGKFLEYDLLRKAGSKNWIIQIPNHNAGGVITNWAEPYTLTALQVHTLLQDGLHIELVRQGKTFYLYLNGIKVDTREIEGAETVKVAPGILHFGNDVSVDFAYDFSTEYSAETWDSITVKADDVTGGNVAFDKATYSAMENIVITANPDPNYILIDVIVNGYSYAADITADNTLTIKADAGELNVEPVFVEATGKVERKVVNFPNADGLQVRLTQNGTPIEGSEKTVANGKTEFTQISVGRYRIQVKAFGVWGDTDKILTVNGRGTEATIQIDNAAVLASGNWSIANNSAELETSVGGLSIEDGWFVTKISGLDQTQFTSGTFRFGFRIDYADAVGRNYIIAKDGAWKFQVYNDWKECNLNDSEFAKSWLKNGTPFYFAVHRTNADGNLDVYMGTSVDNLVKVCTPEQFHGNTQIVRFGLWKSSGAYDVTFSETKYGATAQEAFGVTLSQDALTVTGTDNVEHGTVNADATKCGRVELTVTPNEGYVLSALTINGENWLAKYDPETKKVFVSDCYLRDELAITATFEKAAPVTPVVTFGEEANGLKVKLMKDGVAVESSERTVTDGVVTFPELEIGVYDIWAEAFGLWGNTGLKLSLQIGESNYSLPLAGAGVLLNGTWATAKDANDAQEVSLGDLTIGDGWFVTKVSGLTDVDGEIRFGFRIDYEDAVNRDYTILKQNGSWKFQVLYDWKECGLHQSFATWLSDKTNFYFVVHRTKESGAIDVYMGAGLDSLIKVGSPEATHAGKNIVRFGLKKEKGAFDLTFSETKYAATLQEAFGFENDATISVNNNAPESGKTENHGAISVNGTAVGNAVTLGIQTDTSDSSKHYICTSVKVNGVERLQDFKEGSLTISQMYLKDTLTIEATFAEAQKYAYAGTAKYFKANEWHNFTDVTLVFTDGAGTATEVAVTDGAFSVQLYTDTYTVSLKDGSAYILQQTSITVGEEAQESVELKAAQKVFVSDAYGYDEVIAQNTFVEKTVYGETVTFDGSLTPNKEHKMTAFADYAQADLTGNFSIGMYVKTEKDYTESPDDKRFLRFGIRFSDNTSLYMCLHKDTKTWKFQVTHEDNPAVTGWADEKNLGAEAGKALQEGAYVQLIRIGNNYHWVFNGEVKRTDTLDKTPAELKLYRGWEWDIRLTDFAFKVDRITSTELNITNNATADISDDVHGKVTATGTFGSAVTLNVTLDTRDSAKHYILTSLKVNGVERKDEVASGSLKVSDCYVRKTLKIEATFAEAQKYAYAGTAQYFKANEWHNLAGATLVFTDGAGDATEVSVETNGTFRAELYTGNYTVSLQEGSAYILQHTTVSIGEDAQESVDLRAAWRVFAQRNAENNGDIAYSYEEVIKQNTPVEKTLSGETITFNGLLDPARSHGGAVIADSTLNALTCGNFSVGIYVKLPQDYNVSGDQRIAAPGVRFEGGKTFFIFFMPTGASSGKLQIPQGWYNNLATGWWEVGMTEAQMDKAKNDGVYVQLVRVGTSYYWLIDNEVMRRDTITETPQEFMFIRGSEGSAPLNELLFKMEAFDGFKEGTSFRSSMDALIAENVTGDFEAQITIKATNAGDYRGGFALDFGDGNTFNLDMTNNGDTGTKSQLQMNGGISSGWNTLSWPEGSNPAQTAIAGDGCKFILKRTTVDGNCTITITAENENGATYTINSSCDKFNDSSFASTQAYSGAVSIRLRADKNVMVTIDSIPNGTQPN